MKDAFLKKSDKMEDMQEKASIIRLFGEGKLEEIQEKIAKATGLAFVTVDYKGEPVTETTAFTGFCKKVREDEKACDYCKRSDAFGALQAVISRKPSVYFCPCGLLEVAIPIEDKGVFLGGFIGGQIRCEDAPADVNRLNQLFKQDKDILDSKEMEQLKQKVKCYSYNQFVDIVNLIHMIINQICENEISHVKDTSKMKEVLQEYEKENNKLRDANLLLENKIADLKMRYNQYFMVNVLSTISNVATLENASHTNALLLEMADYVKNTAKTKEKYISLGREMEQVERYIHLTCAKYDNHFSSKILIQEKMRNRKIPSGAILAVVQNAVYYGIALGGTEKKISIEGTLQDNICQIIIEENGPGYTDEELQERFQAYEGGFEGKYIDRAFYETRKNFKESFGEEYDIKIEHRTGKGRTFTVRIPKIEAEGGFDDE